MTWVSRLLETCKDFGVLFRETDLIRSVQMLCLHAKININGSMRVEQGDALWTFELRLVFYSLDCAVDEAEYCFVYSTTATTVRDTRVDYVPSLHQHIRVERGGDAVFLNKAS